MFGLRAVKASDDAGKVEPERNTQDTIDDIGDKQNLADIFFASAGVVAVGATILYFMTDWGDERAGDQSPGGLEVQAVLTPNGAGLVWRGSL